MKQDSYTVFHFNTIWKTNRMKVEYEYDTIFLFCLVSSSSPNCSCFFCSIELVLVIEESHHERERGPYRPTGLANGERAK